MNEKILEVNDLKISFRTSGGKVQAVRSISFDLNKGETLCIVGESGSGKSVTSRAIMGIYSANAIIENGEILYDGQDLLKISEENYQKIRGNKIAMIFQDPMSSLNPIVKIGKQLTEAMIVKGRSEKHQARKDFNMRLSEIEKYMLLTSPSTEEVKLQCKKFNDFSYRYLQLQKDFNNAYNNASTVVKQIDEILFEIEKSAFSDEKSRLNEIYRLGMNCFHQYVVNSNQEVLIKLLKELHNNVFPVYKKSAINGIVESLKTIRDIINNQLKDLVEPDYFSLAYYLSYPDDVQIDLNDLHSANKLLVNHLNEKFLNDFTTNMCSALEKSHQLYLEKKRNALNELEVAYKYFSTCESLDKKSTKEIASKVIKSVEEAIEPLSLKKDTQEYVFKNALLGYIETYFSASKNNQKETKRFNKETKIINNILSKGKIPEWKPTPASIIDEVTVLKNIITLVENLIKHYQSELAISNLNFQEIAKANIESLKSSAAKVVFSVTKKIAKEKAISILHEVGITEPRKRYNQYPFQFSGGMRQRIVIAIALVADPEILICDEPTTALDVTIQANILELINRLKEEKKLSVIFITHDLGVVANMADKVAVMYAGKIVEMGTSDEVFYNPRHPYTWALLSSMPDLDTNETLEAIPGTPPNMIYPPKGDAFAPRNKYALELDFEEEPPLFKVSDTHYAATWLLHPDAPKVDIPKSVISRIERMNKRGIDDGN